MVFFFSSRRRHTRSYGDWSSDVCSSDLGQTLARFGAPQTESRPDGSQPSGRFFSGAQPVGRGLRCALSHLSAGCTGFWFSSPPAPRICMDFRPPPSATRLSISSTLPSESSLFCCSSLFSFPCFVEIRTSPAWAGFFLLPEL